MPHQGKANPKEKVRAMKAIRQGEMGICEAGRRLGGDEASIRRWMERYEGEGPNAFLPAKQNRSYPPEMKSVFRRTFRAGNSRRPVPRRVQKCIKSISARCLLDGVQFTPGISGGFSA
ncbi:MAG: helix-turn-helix domain-containing protein [Oscillospiraceae bacterium]